jgi:NADH-quinone oxidoreductase subunit I
MNIKEYFSSLIEGTHSLIKGMEVTGKELFTKKVTEQYPENRAELKIPERFRATLQFIYDDEGYHKCIACKTCERNCPNGTIEIITRMVDLPNGKKKMKLDKYMYDLGSCTFCGLCVSTCPTNAIEFSNDFEQAVFRREALLKQLNYLPEKEKPAPEPKPAPAAKPVAPKPEEPKPEPKVEESKPESKAEEPKDVQDPNVEQKETE